MQLGEGPKIWAADDLESARQPKGNLDQYKALEKSIDDLHHHLSDVEGIWCKQADTQTCGARD